MEIENKKGIFDIDPETEISIEHTNPLLSEQGSMSLPYSLKRTAKNDYLMDFPHKYERAYQYQLKQQVNLRAGVLNEIARMEMLSVTSDTLDVVFYLYESSFYSQVKEVKLTTIFDGIKRFFQPESVPQEERVSHILNMFEQMIFSEPDLEGDFTVFPVAVNAELYPMSLSLNVGGTTKPQEMINEVYLYHNTATDTYEKRYSPQYPYQYTDDDDNIISIPKGYGASPFLRFGYVLRKIFEYFDLKLEPTIFETNPSFRKWCLVHNTMDAILPGYFIESQLVPDCTVNEFLEVIRGMFGDFFIDMYSKTARLVFFNDLMDAEPDMDLTEYLTSPYTKIEYSTPKQVKLTVEKSTELADTATDTYEEFKKKYQDYKPVVPEPFDDEPGVYPIYNHNSIWKLSKFPFGPLFYFKTDWISSMNFDYYTEDELEYEEHKFAGDAIGTTAVVTGNDALKTRYIAPVIETMRNLNSLIVIDGKKITEETTECPIMLRIEDFWKGNRTGIHSNVDGFHPDGNPPRRVQQSTALG
ncbi:MAG: hypothetical protein LUH22_06920 [Bacteroides sp.]|nr:hypothetical protein [Bacteroides sp.]